MGKPDQTDADVVLRRIPQRTSRDCGVCAIAMVTGHSYEKVAAHFTNGGVDLSQNGIYAQGVVNYLAENGFAVRPIAQYRGFMSGPAREPWPPLPFTNVHLVHTKVSKESPCDHFVAMDSSGMVIDPLCDKPKSLADYWMVLCVYGIYAAHRVKELEGLLERCREVLIREVDIRARERGYCVCEKCWQCEARQLLADIGKIQEREHA